MARQQVTGNVGMYFAAYRLSQMGWNVMPTSRNARGIDLLAYDAAVDRKLGIQVKALSKRSPVPASPTDYLGQCCHWAPLLRRASHPIDYVKSRHTEVPGAISV